MTEPHVLVRAVTAKDRQRTVLIRELPTSVIIADQMGARSGDWLRRTAHDHFAAAVTYYQARGYHIGTEHVAAYFPRNEDHIFADVQ